MILKCVSCMQDLDGSCFRISSINVSFIWATESIDIEDINEQYLLILVDMLLVVVAVVCIYIGMQVGF